MRVPMSALLSVVVLAGCGRDDGSGASGASGASATSAAPTTRARPIPGGTATKFAGVTFDIPPGWTFQEGRGGAVLLPGNTVRDEELFLLVSDPQSRTFDRASVDRSVEDVVGKMNPKAKRKGDPVDRTWGDVQGRELRFTATLDNGRKGEYRVFAFQGDRDSALLAIGTWAATDSTITFTDRTGSRTCTLEKRNHPKKVNDPMIVLDGKSFVTATRKAPW